MVSTVDQLRNEEASVAPNGIPAAAIRAALDRILRSRVFIHSHRIRRFLQFVVEECLSGQQHRLKEYLIGLEVFNRLDAFDPRVDSIVRVEARRLRAKLEEYYQTEGHEDEIRIDLRKGSYVPLFEHRRAGYENPSLPQARRSSLALGVFSGADGDAPEQLETFARELTHLLVRESACRVLAREDGAAARADYVLDGTVHGEGAGGQVLLQLREASEGAYIWSESGGSGDLERLIRSLNRALVTAAAERESGQLQRHRSQGQGFDQYVQGRYRWKQGTPESFRVSGTLFAKAVERDPGFAPAWAALAQSLTVSSLFGSHNAPETAGRVKDAAQRAIDLNGNLPEAHVALGAALSLFDWAWEDGEREFLRAIQLDPRDPGVHTAYGIQLACRGMMRPAMLEAERALDLDPACLPANFVLGWMQALNRRYDDSIAQHTLVAQLAPDFPLSYLGLGWAHLGKGLYADALAYFTNAANLLKSRAMVTGCMGHCYARLGKTDEALRHLALLTTQAAAQYASPVSIAGIYAGMGQPERAFSWLEQAVQGRDAGLAPQLLNPEFDSLRGRPEFTGLLARIGLGPAYASAESSTES